jgi:hypothetical protein
MATPIPHSVIARSRFVATKQSRCWCAHVWDCFVARERLLAMTGFGVCDVALHMPSLVSGSYGKDGLSATVLEQRGFPLAGNVSMVSHLGIIR